MMPTLTLGGCRINPFLSDALFGLEIDDLRCTVNGPSFEVDRLTRSNFIFDRLTARRTLAHGGEEIVLLYHSTGISTLDLAVTLRSCPGSPLLRMRYQLSSSQPAALTKSSGQDGLRYFSLSLPGLQSLNEVQLTHFENVLHSYSPSIETYPTGQLYDGAEYPGPILFCQMSSCTLLAAYEHGADNPQSFLVFHLVQAGPLQIECLARKGNTFDGQPIGPTATWESVWLELGLLPGGLNESLARYRRFVLEEMNPHPATRQPRICYNTWNFQERNHIYHKRPYLESMNLERMLAEIDTAHRMGIDVFVIDTGWYNKTGDWQVDPLRFPDGLHDVKRRLDSYGMQLGLWFNPIAAALSSGIYREHPEYEMSWNGQPRPHVPIWETEESAFLCLASGYADRFIQTMLQFREELGVTYFKWDAVDQYGCNSPLHQHGTSTNSDQERADCYAYQMGNAMVRIIETVTERFPDVVVDFDATECNRFVGLGLLGAGRYFLINNGSYYRDFDTSPLLGIEPYGNAFFFPGPARPRVVRRASLYDSILPSHLFLTHYLPDGPALARRNSLASLVLGGNGIWGDLLELTQEDVDFWAENLADYKRVAASVCQAVPIVRGWIGSSPEVHEKIVPSAACGLLSFFTVNEGTFTYVTQPLTLENLAEVKGADAWETLPGGQIKLSVHLERDEARTVFLFARA